MNLNPMCGGAHCNVPDGEVRVLPTGGDSNAILCRACFQHEIRWRRGENLRRGADNQFPLPTWEELKVYDPGV